MKKKIIALVLTTAMTVSVISGCGNAAADTAADTSAETPAGDSQSTETEASSDSSDTAATDSTEAPAAESGEVTIPTNYEELIASLHAGQAYAFAPICEGEDALLVTNYIFDDLEGHIGTYEATIYVEKDNSVEKVTTVQSGGTAYPIALTDDNSLITCMRNSINKGHVNKQTGEYVITEESNVNYLESEDGDYHNYKEGEADLPADSSLFDELFDKYSSSEIISFEKAGMASDGTPHLAGAVYAAYSEEEQYNVLSYFVFESETSGHTQSPDGVTGLPFEYELSGEDITFHFGSADDNSAARITWNEGAYPAVAFAGDGEFGSDTILFSCLGNADAASFDAATYYDNDNNLFMMVKSFDETSLTGDMYREERIKAEYVDSAKENDNIYSVNGTQFTVVSFEDVNSELDYATDEEFKKDVVGTTRFDGFLVKCSDDDFYYALEKEEYATEYNVVAMMSAGNLRKLVEENVTFKIRDNCEIILQKFVENGESAELKEEYIIGREFKGDNYPGWSEGAKEYYMTSDMLVAVSAVDGELYNFVQVYIP